MTSFDRTTEDVGNVLNLEHVNLTVPDQGLAALFYVTGLGFTRDPYIDFGTRNMWINAGEQQFHLPLGKAQVFRGHIAAVVPDLDGLQRRLGNIAKPLDGSRFRFEQNADHVRVTCPWGNDVRVYGPDHFPAMTLGLPRLDVQVPPDTARGIAAFYRQVMECPATVTDGRAHVRVGHNQTLTFSESARPLAPYDGHHIAIYVANFSGPHRRLLERGLVTEESDQHQYRFQAIVDPASNTVLTELEHEVRSMAHPMFHRPLVNRNPALNFFNYRKGSEVYTPA
jgi:catechol-2,3-dioxygenase